MSGILPDSGFPASGSNRTRAEVQAAIADMIGGANKPDVKTLADRAWEDAVRSFNSVAWAFTRVTDDIIIDSSMKAAISAPTVSNTGSGVGFTLENGRTINYWIEERIKSGARVLARNDVVGPGTGGPFTVILTGTGAVVRPVIARPAMVNPEATHWALFATAADNVLSSTDSRYPHGYEVAEVAATVASIEDTRVGINPGIPANQRIYQSGEYDLSAPFRNPVSALAKDASGQTRYRLSWVPFRQWQNRRPSQITTGSNPLWYTCRNWYRTGRVTFDPRPGASTTYPFITLTYNTPILTPQGSDPDGRLDVPVEIDQAIFQRASVIARRRIIGPTSVGPDELRELQEAYFELEVQWRDHPDY